MNANALGKEHHALMGLMDDKAARDIVGKQENAIAYLQIMQN